MMRRYARFHENDNGFRWLFYCPRSRVGDFLMIGTNPHHAENGWRDDRARDSAPVRLADLPPGLRVVVTHLPSTIRAVPLRSPTLEAAHTVLANDEIRLPYRVVAAPHALVT
jgi:hypothetical protein